MESNDSSCEGMCETTEHQLYAKYGKACLNCVKSKTRCATGATGGKCERCTRLSKDCQPATTVRKKRVSKRTASSTISKTAALEEKLDGIVQMLQRSQSAIPTASQPLPLCSSRPEEGPSSFVNLITSKFETRTASSFTNPVILPPSEQPEETEADMEQCLETYRTKLFPGLPIVHIKPEITMKELKLQRPFLHLVIRTISTKNMKVQGALTLQVKKTLAQEMLIEGTRSMDLFLGVLTFLLWYHISLGNRPIISTMMHLTLSLAADLGILKPLSQEPVNFMRLYISSGWPKNPSASKVPRAAKTLEERRVALGLFLVNSAIANYFQRIEIMRWSPYLDECVRILQEQLECPTDEMLVYLVRVQLICNNGSNTLWNELFSESNSQLGGSMYSKTLKSQLDDLENSMPLALKSNEIIRLQILNANITILSQSLSVSPNQNPTTAPVYAMTHLRNLNLCLSSSKAWFSLFLDINHFPIAGYPHLSLCLMSQLASCMVVIYRLSIFDSSSLGFTWDKSLVRQELDLVDIIKTVSDQWKAVPVAANLIIGPDSEDAWTHTGRGIHAIGKWWEGVVAAMDIEKTGVAETSLNGNNENGQENEQQALDPMDFSGMNMDMVDDSWMRDMLSGGYDFNLDPFGMYN